MQLIELLRVQLENLKSPSDIRKYLCFILKIELHRFDVSLSIVSAPLVLHFETNLVVVFFFSINVTECYYL